MASVTFTKLSSKKVSLRVRHIIAGSLDDGLGCNRGTLILSWVEARGKKRTLSALTDYIEFAFRVSGEKKSEGDGTQQSQERGGKGKSNVSMKV